MKFFFKLLNRLYSRVDLLLPSGGESEKFCGNCCKCCTAAASQTVSKLEKDYIREFLRLNEFSMTFMEEYERFLFARAEVHDTSALSIFCPFYDTDEHLCVIYDIRPYSCRIYGNYSQSVDDLPKDCSYRNIVKCYVNVKVVPFSETYVTLVCSYYVYDKYFKWLCLRNHKKS